MDRPLIEADPSVATEPSDRELRHGFESFVEAARRLEVSYTALRARAAEIDVQLAEANARLALTLREREAVLDALPVGVIAIAADGSRRFGNPEGERVLGEAAKHGVDLLAVEAGKHEVRDLVVRVSHVPMPDGGQLALLEDRSRVAHLEREVDRLDRLAGLSELALGVAHEIKNPLNGVLGFASLLERQDDPVQLRRYARRIGDGMREIDSIVKAMLAFARPRGGELVPRSVGDVANAAAREANVPPSRWSVRGATTARTDGPTLTRVLANLFRNSLEAGAQSIEISVEERFDSVLIEVRDDGPGVPSECGARVFEPFVSTKDRGHGLGLALVARVLSFLGGSIVLANPGEAGARFCIRMPRLHAGESLGSVGREAEEVARDER